MAKPLSDIYLYKKFPDYNKKLYEFIVGADRIDTKSTEFADVLFDVKRRRISNSLAKILVSKKIVLATTDESLPKAFKVFVAKDPKDSNIPKLFIDGTEYIKFKDGTYDCTNIDWLISYTISGMIMYIYAVAPQRLLLDSTVISAGSECFSRLFSYIIDRMYKITSVQSLKKKVDYLGCLYYQINILGKEFLSESQFRSIKAMAMKITDIDDRDAKVVDLQLKADDFSNIYNFTLALSHICDFKDMKIDALIGMWGKSFGTGTVFAPEYFPAFSAMLTNSYIGGYIDNQITIEKLCGPKMVEFVKAVLKIGDAVV